MGFLRKLLGFGSASPDACLARGLAHVKKKAYAKAITELTEAIHLDPKNVNAYRWRSHCYAALGDEANADSDYSRVQQLREPVPTQAESRFSAEFLALLDAANRGVDVDEAKKLAQLAERQLDEDHVDEAIATFTQAIEMLPQWTFFHGRGRAYMTAGRFADAIPDLERAASDLPGSKLPAATEPSFAWLRANLFLCLGQCHKQQGHFNEALRAMSNAIDMHPDAEAYFFRGNVYCRQGRYHDAMIDLTEAIRRDPKDFKSYQNRGAAYVSLRRYDEAIQDFSDAIRLNAAVIEAYQGRAAAYRALGQENQAHADERKAEELSKRAEEAGHSE
jgi:tetratricopeptide (TPR) repeat protein